MKKAIIHIGTEKTGSTSLQNFLVSNGKALKENGFLYPSCCGYVSNTKLVIYSLPPAFHRLNGLALDLAEKADKQRWNAEFEKEHEKEVLEFQSNNPNGSTVIYSSEHFQSRLHNINEIQRVHDLLTLFYDEVRVLVYLRRQDQMAFSAHSTMIRSGLDKEFSFNNISATGYYFDYRKLLTQWSTVFTENCICAKLYDKSRLVKHDIVSDFCDFSQINENHSAYLRTHEENKALSHTALCYLREFNRQVTSGVQDSNLDSFKFRVFLISELSKITDNYGSLKPARQGAIDFYNLFRENNKFVIDKWLGGTGFSESFDDYPEIAGSPAEVEGAQEFIIAAKDRYLQQLKNQTA